MTDSGPIHVPRPKAVIFHPDGQPYQVLLFDNAGKKIGTVMFTADDAGHDLAYEYYAFKTGGSHD